MSSPALVPITGGAVGYLLPVQESAREYARRAKSPATQLAYKTDWRHFSAWCENNAFSSLPATPETVACYLGHLADTGKKAATITRRLVAISQIHQVQGFATPTQNELVRSVLKGIRRTIGTAQDGKTPLVAADIKEIVGGLPDTLIGRRDRALLLIGFSGAFRRSEIVALNYEDLEFTEEGLVVTLRRSKTDQESRGRRIGIPVLPHSDACAVRALREWLVASGITSDSIFRPVRLGSKISAARLSGFGVARIIKKRLPAGKDAAKYSGHSLRSGYCTSACSGGAPIKSIQNVTGHRSVDMLLRYVRETSLFRKSGLSYTGL